MNAKFPFNALQISSAFINSSSAGNNWKQKLSPVLWDGIEFGGQSPTMVL